MLTFKFLTQFSFICINYYSITSQQNVNTDALIKQLFGKTSEGHNSYAFVLNPVLADKPQLSESNIDSDDYYSQQLEAQLKWINHQKLSDLQNSSIAENTTDDTHLEQYIQKLEDNVNVKEEPNQQQLSENITFQNNSNYSNDNKLINKDNKLDINSDQQVLPNNADYSQFNSDIDTSLIKKTKSPVISQSLAKSNANYRNELIENNNNQQNAIKDSNESNIYKFNTIKNNNYFKQNNNMDQSLVPKLSSQWIRIPGKNIEQRVIELSPDSYAVPNGFHAIGSKEFFEKEEVITERMQPIIAEQRVIDLPDNTYVG
ncbi:GATA zinc finger domain-containing protein 14-like [Oppia nitens]|uniref:GATA zinc finger domain-containing protein 14-like n=1 Tax=Oppia nitens TaxID=1686743 RepID=UPI0023D9F8DC|nr:GATA zinc finger domain-containing protein 14-like [Oppia nitens]